jgi:hypothetical protein
MPELRLLAGDRALSYTRSRWTQKRSENQICFVIDFDVQEKERGFVTIVRCVGWRCIRGMGGI